MKVDGIPALEDHLKITKESSVQQRTDLQQQITELQAQAQTLTQDNEGLRRENSLLRNLTAGIPGREQAFGELKGRLEQESHDLEQQLAALKVSDSALRTELKEVKTAKEGLRAQNESFFDDFSKSLEKLSQELEETRKNRDVWTDRVATLQKEGILAAEKVDKVNTEKAILANQVTELNTQKCQLTQELHQVKGEKAVLVHRVTESDSQRDRSGQRLDEVNKEKAALAHQVADMDSQQGLIGKELEELKAEKAVLTFRITGLEARIHTLEGGPVRRPDSRQRTDSQRRSAHDSEEEEEAEDEEVRETESRERSVILKRKAKDLAGTNSRTDKRQRTTPPPADTWQEPISIGDIRKADFNPEPVPKEIWHKLRAQMSSWDTKSRPDWMEGAKKGSGYCAARFVLRASTKRQYEGFACDHCSKHRLVCVVIGNGTVKLCPMRYPAGDDEDIDENGEDYHGGFGPEEEGYWVNDNVD